MSIKINEEEILIGTMYAPFCRTKYVEKDEWEKDISKMHELGFTCLHGFSEWWRVEKEKGVFDFSETDYLIELCVKYDIVPIINVATQNGVGYYMPSWLQREYHGSGFVDNEGRGNPMKTEYTVPCMDDPTYQVYARRYLQALASHYAGDCRVGGWVIWGEPCLTKFGKPICYCEHTISRFRTWLRNKYKKIENLNNSWGNEGPADYADFNEINPPTGQFAQRGSYASWADFQSFMCENLSSRIKEADEIFKTHGATQPTIAELFCYISNDSMCNDIWSLAECADIVGVSNFNRPGVETEIVMTVANSIAKRLNKSIFVVEANGGPRYPGYDLRTPCEEEIVSEAVQMVGANAKGLMYWCYRPRLSDFEAGTYGMCRSDGKPLPRAYAAGKIAQQIKELKEVLVNSERYSEAAVLYSSHAVHLTAADMLSQTLWQSVMGAIKLLIDLHITPCLVNEDMLREGLDSKIKLLILPFSYSLCEESAKGIKRFVENGGCVIADCNLAFKNLCGVAYRMLPGGGLDKVFGIEKDDIIHTEHISQLGENSYDIPVGNCLDIIEATSAKVIEKINNRPLITKNSFGKGEAWYFAWQSFANYQNKGGIKAFREMLLKIAADNGVLPFVKMTNEIDEISISEQKICDEKRIITVTNASFEEKKIEISIPNAKSICAIISADDTVYNGESAVLRLRAWQSAMFFCK